jgi:molybdopterin-guanine dinucleotide biosynthesis protein A
VSGIILNGGASRRFGSDKSALILDGRPLLQRTVDVLAGLFDEIPLVGRPAPPAPADPTDPTDRLHSSAHAARGTRHVLSSHASRITHHVPDAIPGAGPLGGIYTGLLAMTRPFGFFVACDMPLLDPAVIRRQLEVLRGSEADAVVPTWDGYWEPLHAAYSQDCLPAVRRQTESGDLRIRRFFGSVNVLYWNVVAEGISPRAFANVNTKGDLVALLGGDPEWRAR